MSISLSNAILVKQRAFAETRKPHVQLALKNFFSYVGQHLNPQAQFQIVFFTGLADSEVVIADAACKFYALFMRVPVTADTATFVKMTDHATTSSDASSEFRFKFGGLTAIEEEIVIYHRGYPMANGITMQGNTTANGGTASDAADQCSGFVILGAP